MSFMVGEDGQWQPLGAAEVHQMDQSLAKFTDILRRLVTITMRGVHNNSEPLDSDKAQEDFENFAATVMELDGGEIISFVSFLVAMQIRQTLIIDKMSGNLGNILTTVIECMADEGAKKVFRKAHEDVFANIAARDQLFEPSSFEAMDLDQLKAAESYTTGTGKRVLNVHREGTCLGACVIHRPISGPWDEWPTDWNEGDKMMMRVCPCGTKHPVIEDILRGHDGSHHCCGCPCGQTAINEKIESAFAKLKEDIDPNGPPPTITIEFGEDTNGG